MAIFNTVYGGEWKWKPNANTIAYYPLTSATTVNDMSGNNHNLTNTSISFGTYQWVDCASSSAARRYLWVSWVVWATYSCWTYWSGSYTWNSSYACVFSQWNNWPSVMTSKDGSKPYNNNIWLYYVGTDKATDCGSGGWHNIVVTIDWTSAKIYWDGELKNSISSNTLPSGDLYMFAFSTNLSGGDWYLWGISEFIVESKVRTADEITKYYNSTKWNY